MSETTPPRVDRSPTALIVVNLVILGLLWAVIVFVMPVFAAMFADFGAELAAPTQYLIDLSAFLRRFVWPCVPATVVAVLSPLFSTAYDTQKRWLRRVMVIQAAILAATICCAFLPIFDLGTVAQSIDASDTR